MLILFFRHVNLRLTDFTCILMTNSQVKFCTIRLFETQWKVPTKQSKSMLTNQLVKRFPGMFCEKTTTALKNPANI